MGGVVVDLPTGKRGSGLRQAGNSVSFSSSFRKRPLKLSMLGCFTSKVGFREVLSVSPTAEMGRLAEIQSASALYDRSTGSLINRPLPNAPRQTRVSEFRVLTYC